MHDDDLIKSVVSSLIRPPWSDVATKVGYGHNSLMLCDILPGQYQNTRLSQNTNITKHYISTVNLHLSVNKIWHVHVAHVSGIHLGQ